MTHSIKIYEILKNSGLFCPAPNVKDAVDSLTEESVIHLSEDVVEFHKRIFHLSGGSETTQEGV